MRQTPQEIALEFAKVIGYAKPSLMGYCLIIDTGNLTNPKLDYYSINEVLELAMEWLKQKNMMLVHLVPGIQDSGDVWICEIAIPYNSSVRATNESLPQAIMLAVIKADKILKKELRHEI